ncbi:MAG: hypothetical protein ABFQ65_02470 [Nanoarchaeota archaeon]
MPKVQEEYINLKNWVKNNITKENLKLHLVDSTAVSTVLVPIASFIDTYFAGMTNEEAIKARFLVGLLTYGCFGTLISRSGEFYRKSKDCLTSKLLKLPELTFYSINEPEIKNKKDPFWIDSARLAGGSIIASLPLYYAFGVSEMKMAIGTLITAIASPLVLGATNLVRNVAGLETSYPISFFRDLNPKAKKGLVALIGATAIVSTAGVYNLNKEKPLPSAYPQKGIELVYTKISTKSLENYLIK